MGEGTGTFSRLLTFLESAISLFPENRRRRNLSYRVHDLAMSAFSVFFTLSPCCWLRRTHSSAETIDRCVLRPVDHA
jgi:hypothetical protein